jgi:hypothetical protein
MSHYEVHDSVDGTKCVIEVRLPNSEVIYRLNSAIHITEEGTYCVLHHLTNSIDRLVEFPYFESSARSEVAARKRAVMERETIAQRLNNTPQA